MKGKMRTAVMTELMKVGLHAAKLGGASPGQTAVITGMGCIGLCSLPALKSMGVSKAIAADKGAAIVSVGYSVSGEKTPPIGMAPDKEVTFKTVFRYRNIYPMAIEAVAGGQIKVADIVTDCFELNDIQNARDTCVKDKANVVKGVIKISDGE